MNQVLLDDQVARVISENKGQYKVKLDSNEYPAIITGTKMFTSQCRSDYPAVGDWVVVNILTDGKAVIQEVLQRKSILSKKYNTKQDLQIIATNIDTMFVIEAVDRDYNLNRFERYMVLAKKGNIEPVLILNKIDLIAQNKLSELLKEVTDRFNFMRVITTSVVSEHGLSELESIIEQEKTYCFVGSSGVGKSSLINKLLNTNEIETKEISTALNRGKHTTTSRQMYFLPNGGIVIDSPGMRTVGIADMADSIEETFWDKHTESLTCKYANCSHTHEPGCVIKEAVEKGNIDEGKYRNYLKLKKEADFYTMTEVERRTKNRAFGRMVKSAQKHKV